MALTYGFYNSVAGDRSYNATQMSSLFDGIINDGVFMSIGDALVVSAASDMNVNVGIGRAWFNHTWTNNDAALSLTVEQAELVLNRIDTVVLEVNAGDDVRANSLKIIKGTPGSSPVAPTLSSSYPIYQHPLADIYVGAGVTSIVTANITNRVGTSDCPFITGILETINVDALLAQWDAEFDTWFATVQSILDSETAGNLLNLINEHKADYKMQIPYGGATTNVGNAYSLASPTITALEAGMAVCFACNADSTGAVTLNWDGKGAKAIKKANGGDITNLKTNGMYTVRYNGVNFQLQGEGGEYGTAGAAQTLTGYSLGTENGVIPGTMPNRTGDREATSISAEGNVLYFVPEAGYYDGTTARVGKADVDFTEDNIMKDVNLFGKVGTLIPSTFFGNGSDGALTAGATIASTNQGDGVVKQYSSINLPAGHTLTVSNPCKYLEIRCKGNCVISGSITMTGKAPYSIETTSNPMSVTLPSGTVVVLGTGGRGGNGGQGGTIQHVEGPTTANGGYGGTGNPNGSIYGGGRGGGGGGGSAVSRDGDHGKQIGNGGHAYTSTYSSGMASSTGGAAVGAGYHEGKTGINANGFGAGGSGGYTQQSTTTGGSYSGRGGNANATNGGGAGGGGGSEDFWNYGSYSGAQGQDVSGHGGGVIILKVGGNLTINAGGSILARGDNGGNGGNCGSRAFLGGATGGGGGGGAGGGIVFIAHGGTYSNSGSVSAAGGTGGSGGNYSMDAEATLIYAPYAGNSGTAGVVSVNQA